MNCPSCGKSNPDNCGYCLYCGGAVGQAAQAQYVPPQNQYAPPPPGPAPYMQGYYPYMRDETVTMGEWFVFFLIMCIPIVNFVMLFVWGFGSSAKRSKANLCKLQLLLMAIGVGLYLIIAIIVLAAFGSFPGF